MASTTLPPRNQAPGARPAPTLVPGGGRQRRWSLALLAVLVTLGSALAFVVLWMNAGEREPVLALARDVPAGQVFQAEDLTTVRVSLDPGVRAVASSARDQVIGQPASVDMLAGTLLVPDAVGDTQGLENDKETVAIAIDQTLVPAGLERGDHVRIVRMPGATGSGEVQDPVNIGIGRVSDVTDSDSGTDVRVSVSVDRNLVPQIYGGDSDQLRLAETAARED
jgi:type IV secretory pathway VirJ component